MGRRTWTWCGRGHVMSTETAMSWELDPMVVESGHIAMSVRDVVDPSQSAAVI